MTEHNMDHMGHLEAVAAADVAELRRKEATYRGSWKRGGGRSTWFMLRRKIDRLLVMMAKPPDLHGFSMADLDEALRYVDDTMTGASDITIAACVVRHLRDCYMAENIFAKIREQPDGVDGSVLAEVRDLRRYLLLVEAEMVARGVLTTDKRGGLLGQRAWDGLVPTTKINVGGVMKEFQDLTDREISNVLHGRAADDNGEFTASSMGAAQDAERPPAVTKYPTLDQRPRAMRPLSTPEPRDGVPCLNEDGSVAPAPPWPTIVTVDPRKGGQRYFIVDRASCQLKRPTYLFPELNDKEHELLEAAYRGLYSWSGDDKWKLDAPFRELWGRKR